LLSEFGVYGNIDKNRTVLRIFARDDIEALDQLGDIFITQNAKTAVQTYLLKVTRPQQARETKEVRQSVLANLNDPHLDLEAYKYCLCELKINIQDSYTIAKNLNLEEIKLRNDYYINFSSNNPPPTELFMMTSEQVNDFYRLSLAFEQVINKFECNQDQVASMRNNLLTRPDFENFIATACLPYVKQYAGYLSSKSKTLDYDEIVSATTNGLFKAIRAFPGGQFLGYLKTAMDNCFLDAIRKSDSNSPKSELLSRIRMKKTELTNSLGRSPSNFEVAESLGIEEEIIDRSLGKVKIIQNSDFTLNSVVARDTDSNLNKTTAQDMLEILQNDFLPKLPDAQREIFTLVFEQSLSYTEVADLLEIPLPTVKSRVRLMRLKLQDFLEVQKRQNSIFASMYGELL
jgi:RNA polymerase sigma factor (sigma-70 family)